MKKLHVISYSLLRFKDACTQRSNDLVDLTVVRRSGRGRGDCGAEKKKKKIES